MVRYSGSIEILVARPGCLRCAAELALLAGDRSVSKRVLRAAAPILSTVAIGLAFTEASSIKELCEALESSVQHAQLQQLGKLVMRTVKTLEVLQSHIHTPLNTQGLDYEQQRLNSILDPSCTMKLSESIRSTAYISFLDAFEGKYVCAHVMFSRCADSSNHPLLWLRGSFALSFPDATQSSYAVPNKNGSNSNIAASAIQEAHKGLVELAEVVRRIDRANNLAHSSTADLLLLYAHTRIWFRARRDYKVLPASGC